MYAIRSYYESANAPISIDAEGCTVLSDSGHVVALVGVQDLCVVVEGRNNFV